MLPTSTCQPWKKFYFYLLIIKEKWGNKQNFKGAKQWMPQFYNRYKNYKIIYMERVASLKIITSSIKCHEE